MLTNRVILEKLLKKRISFTRPQIAAHSTGGFFDERYAIGKREWVGYGVNGRPNYRDSIDIPAPAIRFKEIKGHLIALREKEKGDWKKLSTEEKKELYRTSFCQTLVEAQAPTGQWKVILGSCFLAASVVIWVVFFSHMYIYRPLPHTFSPEHKAITLRKMIDFKEGPLSGISSKWDYEKDDWKK